MHWLPQATERWVALGRDQYVEAHTLMSGYLLSSQGDRMAMANSIEARVPFLDYRLVEFIETLPPNLKLRRFRGKYLHKKAVEKWLPRGIVYRKKKGFANPVHEWLRGRMREYIRSCLLADRSAVNLYFNRDFIKETVAKHEANEQNYFRQIYLLLSFELWCRRFLDTSAVADVAPQRARQTTRPPSGRRSRHFCSTRMERASSQSWMMVFST